MTAIAISSLVLGLHQRGVVFEPVGDRLRVNPVEKLKPGELETLREHKQEILNLFESGRLELVACPGSDCSEVLVVMDGLTWCPSHRMSVRFVRGPQ